MFLLTNRLLDSRLVLFIDDPRESPSFPEGVSVRQVTFYPSSGPLTDWPRGAVRPVPAVCVRLTDPSELRRFKQHDDVPSDYRVVSSDEPVLMRSWQSFRDTRRVEELTETAPM